MLQEAVTVMNVEGDQISLSASRSVTCSGCSLKSGCGQTLLMRGEDKVVINNTKALELVPGDRVQMVLSGQQLLRLSGLFYLLPLATLLLMSAMASMLELREGNAVLLAVSGLFAGMLCTRHLLRLAAVQQALNPTLSKIACAGEETGKGKIA